MSKTDRQNIKTKKKKKKKRKSPLVRAKTPKNAKPIAKIDDRHGPLKSISGDFFRALLLKGEEVRAASRRGSGRGRCEQQVEAFFGVLWPLGWSNRMVCLYSIVNGVTDKEKKGGKKGERSLGQLSVAREEFVAPVKVVSTGRSSWKFHGSGLWPA